VREFPSWKIENGSNFEGLCPASYNDIPPRLCTFWEFVFHEVWFEFLLLSPLWMILWSTFWPTFSVLDRWFMTGRQEGLSRAPREIGTRDIIWLLIADVLLMAMVALSRVPSFFYRWLWRHATSEEYRRAWGLPEEKNPRESAREIRLPSATEETTSASFELDATDIVGWLQRWPKACWQPTPDMPAWLFGKFPRKVRPAPWWDGPMTHSSSLPGARGKDSLALFGVRLGKRGAPRSDARWTQSFEEALRRIEEGELAWQWFAIEVALDDGFVSFVHRGYEADMTKWMPICVSDGSSIDRLAGRSTTGKRHGVVFAHSGDDELPVEGAMLSFAHRNGTVPFRAVTDGKGEYRVVLPVGRYGVSVQHPRHPNSRAQADWRLVRPGSDELENYILDR
jgi:hypothetical protein